jgi:6-pyruvoyltetrahydropterin/6-carboxytetrahydropterin synthase
MRLTISKRFEFAASRRCFDPALSQEENMALYGRSALARFGHGANFFPFFVFEGSVDPITGMLINVATIKERLKPVIDSRYDHRFLNADTRPFDTVIPTAENVARVLLGEASGLFDDVAAKAVCCHVVESPETEATAWRDGRVERHHWVEFSAARRTCSPHLSDEENTELFGMAARPSGHGHGYRLRATFGVDELPSSGMVAPILQIESVLEELRTLLDHRNLNVDVPELAHVPMTTESLARCVFGRLARSLPVRRVQLWENSYFFAEYSAEGGSALGVTTHFTAAHRLHAPQLSAAENAALYGKCNNVNGHGHVYRVEAAIGGALDERSGALFSLERFTAALERAVGPWDYKHLDEETEDFRGRPSTSENMIEVLWHRLERELGYPLERVRMWETPNNRFTLRR